MDKHQKEQLKAALVTQRAQISDEINRHGGILELGSTAEMRDPEDRAAAMADLWVDDRLAADDGNLLEKIDLALQRLDDGTYGVCAQCGGSIPVERLLAKPSVSLCVSCQESKETKP